MFDEHMWSLEKLLGTTRVVYNWFFRKLVHLRCTDVTSFRMQFEKEDVGYYGKLFGVRDSGLLTESTRALKSVFI